VLTPFFKIKYAERMKINKLPKLRLHYRLTGKRNYRSHSTRRQKNQFLDNSCWNRLYKPKTTSNNSRKEDIGGGEG
jgi:hypothetical protein